MKKKVLVSWFVQRFAAERKYLGETALSLRSRRSGTKFAEPVGSLIKCRRLPRGFFWNTSFPFASLLSILQMSSFLKLL